MPQQHARARAAWAKKKVVIDPNPQNHRGQETPPASRRTWRRRRNVAILFTTCSKGLARAQVNQARQADLTEAETSVVALMKAAASDQAPSATDTVGREHGAGVAAAKRVFIPPVGEDKSDGEKGK